MKGEIKGGDITKGTVQNETVTGADIKGANITDYIDTTLYRIHQNMQIANAIKDSKTQSD